MLQLRENRSVTVRFVAIVAAATAFIAFAVQDIPIGLEIPVLLRFGGTVTIVAVIISALLNRWLWRIPPISWVLKIPNFSGRWEGWYRRSPDDAWHETAREISQKALDIDAETWGPANWSRSTCSAITATANGLTQELVWAYKTEPTTLDYKPGDTHAGVHFLRLVEERGNRFLIGRYINDRAHEDGKKGAVGEIRVKWVSTKLRHALNFNEERWGLKRPSP